MKTLAILFMVLTVVALLGFGMLYLLGFAMSFDAPGSTKDPQAWFVRGLMFLPAVIMVVLLIISFIAFTKGYYQRAALISGVVPLCCCLFILYMAYDTFNVSRNYKMQRLKEEEDARLYPTQTYLRQGQIGTDTIIVFPSRIVSYRLDLGVEYPFAGPLGDLNETRDTLLFRYHGDTRLKPEELDQFVDGAGRRFTDVYRVK